MYKLYRQLSVLCARIIASVAILQLQLLSECACMQV